MPHTPQIPPLAGMTPLGTRSNVVAFPGITRPLAIDQAEIARRKTVAPLKPKLPQSPCNFGLFSDDAKQTDLVDLTRATSPDPELELRKLWTQKGVSKERQDQMIVEIRAKAQPGTMIGPFRLGGGT